MPLRKTYLPTLNVVNFEFPRPYLHEIDEMKDWLEENNIVYLFKSNYNNVTGVYFDFEEDAVAFKLRWL